MSLLWDPEVAARVDRLELPFNARARSLRHLEEAPARWLLAPRAGSTATTSASTVDGIEHVPPRGRAHAGRQPLGRRRARRGHGARLDVARDGAAAPRAGHGREVHQPLPFASQWTQPHRPAHRPARARRAAARATSACCMVFPEGARGTAKLYRERYSLVRLRHRLHAPRAADEDADRARSPSSAAARPSPRSTNLVHARQAARRAVHPGHAVALAAAAAACRCEIHYGEPMRLRRHRLPRRTTSSSGYVEQVKERIAALIAAGAARRARHESAGHEGPDSRHRRRLARHASRTELLDAGHEVIGIDRRPWPNAPEGIEVLPDRHPQARRRGRVPQAPPRRRHPHGDRHAPDRAQRGPLPHQPRSARARCSITARTTAPSAASSSAATPTTAPPPTRRCTTARTSRRWRLTTFPELADLVAADLYAGSALWRYPELDTCVLRMCYTLGPTVQGTLATLPPRARACRWCSASIRSSSSCTRTTPPTPSALALEKQLRGVFNVAGPQPVPLSMLIRATGRTPVPLPEIVLKLGVRPLRPAGAAAGRGRAHQVSRRRRRLGVPRGDRLHQQVRRRSDHRRVSQRRRLSVLPQFAREE